MALRILQNEVLIHHIGVVQRMLSSAPRPAVVTDTVNPVNKEHASQEKTKSKIIKTFRTEEIDPVKHTENHLARFYTMPEELSQKLFRHGGLTRKFADLCQVFTETSIMVRQPFLEIKSYIERINFSKPAVRMVLYGKPGHGKSVTLSHLVNYGHNAGFLLVHVPWVNTFMRRCKDASPSESKPGMMDVPINAAAWLVHFRTQNQHLLQKLNLMTSKPYKYGPRDSFEAGVPITELIDFGVGRAKYACDLVEDLLREIKAYSNSGLFRTMVVIDGFNGLYAPFVITERRKVLNARCTLAMPFLEMSRFDWCNGVVVVSVDRLAHHDMFNAESDLPLYLLGKEGWEHLDPFIPIHVDKYNAAELNSAIEYYIDRRWIQHPSGKTKEGIAELSALCAGNVFHIALI